MGDIIRSLLIIVIALVIFAVIAMVITVLYGACKTFCIKRLEYKRYFSKEGASEGEEIFLIEELSNHSFLPMFNIDVESHVPSMIKLEGCRESDDINQHFISSFFVKPFTKIKRKHKAVCLKRGYYMLETAQVTFADMDLYIDSKAELFVYPKEIELGRREQLNMVIRQGQMSNMPILEDVFEYAGIRQYTAGDSISVINHKASARMNKFMVNNHQFMMGRKIKMYCNFQMTQDRYQDLDEFKDIMEETMSYIAYLAGEQAERGYIFSYSANCKTVDNRNYIRTTDGTGNLAYMELLKEMAMTRIISNFSFGTILDMDISDNITNTEIYIFTTYMDDSIDNRIDALIRMGNSVQVIRMDREDEYY